MSGSGTLRSRTFTIMLTQAKREIRNHIDPITRYFKRLVKSPFTGPEHLIVHCSHHKVGTVWFKRILERLAKEYGLNLYSGPQSGLPESAHVFLEEHSQVDPSQLRTFRGSHMVRDPRDIVISGYFYHLWTKEEWANIPQERYGNVSYQTYLNALPQSEGLIAEMNRFALEYSDLRDMTCWDYDNPNFLELKYEETLNDEEETFRRLFSHYGFNAEAIEDGLRIADEISFKNYKKKIEKNKKQKSHLRSGKTGEWRDLFDESHKEHCKALMGDALIQLGYESDKDW